jgi:hypothetical protein
VSDWPAVQPLASWVERIAQRLGIIDSDGSVLADPPEITEEYFREASTIVRAFLVLSSSELEEFIESACITFVGDCARGDDNENQHHCFHALSLYFRNNLANYIEREGAFVDFYATPEQARRMINYKKSQSAQGRVPPLLNRKTLITQLSLFYKNEVVANSHGISDQKMIELLRPLGFSPDLVRDECSNLCSALQSLAAARGEAAHRSAQSGGWPFSALPPPLHQQLSIGDAWRRWVAVRDSLVEFDRLIHRKTV